MLTGGLYTSGLVLTDLLNFGAHKHRLWCGWKVLDKIWISKVLGVCMEYQGTDSGFHTSQASTLLLKYLPTLLLSCLKFPSLQCWICCVRDILILPRAGTMGPSSGLGGNLGKCSLMLIDLFCWLLPMMELMLHTSRANALLLLSLYTADSWPLSNFLVLAFCWDFKSSSLSRVRVGKSKLMPI